MDVINLQDIFNERDDWFDNWFENYKKVVAHFIELIKNNEKWTDEDLSRLILEQSNSIADNGQWGKIYNTNKNPEFDNIKAKWDLELLPIIKEVVQNNNITTNQFEKFRNIFMSCCNKNKKLAANRVLAAFLPNLLTTTVNESDFYYVEDKLKEIFSDYTPPTERVWSESNKYFVDYCNKKVKFDHPWQSSIFNWILREYFGIEEEKTNRKIETMKTYLTLLLNNRNLILTGAPGTGKTYLAKQIAKQMILGEPKEEMSEEEKKQFNEQCSFVQFHPSYDYTDFVEGLRPKNDSGNIGFQRKNGILKDLCAKALIRQSADSSITEKLNTNPTVWKVSLAGTGDNPIRKDCMENGYIRIGWKEYGNVDDFNEFEDWSLGGKNILRAFQNIMKEGDIVVSCYSAKEIDAVGVVTGEYEYRDNFEDFPRLRKVDWLVKNIKEDIVEINGCKFTLPTVYKSNITAEDALKIVKKYNPSSFISNNEKSYILIIDEINRGEISKIFGELFFSIDPSYRGEKGRVQTQYQNIIEEGDIFKKGFFVPENVYIIGTMNDIDRSVESMDFAFRRRFAFKEIKAIDRVEMLYDEKNGIGDKAKEAEDRMIRVNEQIEKIEGLSSAYHIGPAYFLKLKNYNGDFDQLWENHIEGLLFEYLRGMTDIQNKLKTLAEAYGYSKADEYVKTSNN